MATGFAIIHVGIRGIDEYAYSIDDPLQLKANSFLRAYDDEAKSSFLHV